jgi:hypothetical protein
MGTGSIGLVRLYTPLWDISLWCLKGGALYLDLLCRELLAYNFDRQSPLVFDMNLRLWDRKSGNQILFERWGSTSTKWFKHN